MSTVGQFLLRRLPSVSALPHIRKEHYKELCCHHSCREPEAHTGGGSEASRRTLARLMPSERNHRSRSACAVLIAYPSKLFHSERSQRYEQSWYKRSLR